MQMAGHPVGAPSKRFKPKPFNRANPFMACHYGFHFKRVLIEYQIPTILTLFILEEVDIIVIGSHFKVNRTLTVPPIDYLIHLISAITKMEGNGSFFYLIT